MRSADLRSVGSFEPRARDILDASGGTFVAAMAPLEMALPPTHIAVPGPATFELHSSFSVLGVDLRPFPDALLDGVEVAMCSLFAFLTAELVASSMCFGRGADEHEPEQREDE